MAHRNTLSGGKHKAVLGVALLAASLLQAENVELGCRAHD